MPNPWHWCIGSSGVSAIAFVSGYKIAIAASQPTPSERPVWCCALGSAGGGGRRACRSFVDANAQARRGSCVLLFPTRIRECHLTLGTQQQEDPFSFCLCLTVLTCSDRVSPSHHPHSLPALSGQGLVGREGKCSKESRHILLLTPFFQRAP